METRRDHDPYEAFRAQGYLPYLLGGVLSSIGGEVQVVAIGWELFERTNSYQLLGLTGLAQFLPVLALVLPAGQVADHFNRRKIYQCTQALSMAASLALAWLSWNEGPIPAMFACLVASGVARAFQAPARMSLLSQIVPAAILPNAVTWNSTGWQFALVSGPAIGGVVLSFAPPAIAYLIAAGGALCCAALLFVVHPQRPASSGARSFPSLFAGVRFVWHSDLLLAAITLDLFAVLLGGATALLPGYAKEILGLDSRGFGLLRAAPAFGAVIMAAALAHRPPMQRPGRALLFSVAGFGVATIVFGISTWWPLSFAMLVTIGALDNISVVVRGTLMQVLTPDEMRGRVGAINSLFINSSNLLGEFESGLVAGWFGPVFSVVSGGIGTLVVVALTAVLAPRLARLAPLHELRPERDESAP